MAHISMIDVPSDTYGEVTVLAKPLVDRLNHASMSRSTFVALSTLLTWAVERMEQVEQDLQAHEVHTGVVSAPDTYVPETPVEEDTGTKETSVDKGNDLGEGANSNEQAPLPAITPAEEAEDAAVAAEIAQAEAEVAAKAEVVAPVEEVAPKTTKRVAKPA